MISKKGFIALVFFFTLTLTTQAQLIKKFALPEDGWVNDVEGLFTQQQQSELNSIISAFEAKTNSGIAVITIKSYEPYSNINDFSKDLSNNWNLIGHNEAKNSLLIIVSKSLHTVRITTAYGTEKLLMNETCKKIINSDMIPSYSKGNYFAGTKQGLLSLMKVWN